MNQMLTKKEDADRIYLPCQEGGRSLMNLEKECKSTMIGLQTYMTNKDDVQIQAVLRHQNTKALHSVLREAEKYLREAGITDDMTNDHGKTATWKAKQLKLKYKEDFKKMVRDRWKEKAMHGKLPNYLDKDHVDVELSFEWMKHTGLKGETHHSSTGSGTKHQMLQQAHHQARNQCHMWNVSYPARNCATHHIRVPDTSSRSVP